MPVTINSPELLQFTHEAVTYYGANQDWYQTKWQRSAGCGPTSTSHLLSYLSKTRETCKALCSYDTSGKSGILKLMDEVWEYVTPTKQGVNKTEMLVDGAVRFGDERGVALSCRVMPIPPLPVLRSLHEKAYAFIAQALSDDLPVAFLNLSSGMVSNLDQWHWVTLTEFDPETKHAIMYDNGSRQPVNLDLWLQTTTLGGGFVAVEPKQEEQSEDFDD